MKNFWLRWFHRTSYSNFVLMTPYWETGTVDGDDIFIYCGAFKSSDREGVVQQLLDSYESFPNDLVIDFIEEKGKDWDPFSDRLQKADWMVW